MQEQEPMAEDRGPANNENQISEENLTSALAQAVANVQGKVQHKNVKFKREGTEIIVPPEMDYDEAIKWLTRKRDEEEEEVGIDEPIWGYPFDAALAFTKAMKEIYGWSNMVPTPGFFGPNPPQMISIDVGPNESVQVPWGRCKIPGIAGFLQTQVDVREKLPILVIGGIVKQKDKHKVHALCDKAREILRRESIYKGKAVRVNFVDPTRKDFDVRDTPKFLDLQEVRPEELIFPDATQELVTSSLFTPVEYTGACRRAQIPLKRGVLLEGPYGTGKTLSAYVMAKKAQENGWTFFYLNDLNDLKQAIRVAKNYEPAVIFAEDIDRIVGEERDEKANEILNTIDGIDAKDRELIVVLTTNNVEKIHRAMLRPGRLDAVIPVRPPDEEAVRRLIRLYGRDLVAKSEDLSGAAKNLSGQIPSVIREVVERAKLSAIARLKGSQDLALSGPDLEAAAKGMLAHLELIKPVPEDDRTDIERAADRVAGPLAEAISGKFGNGVTKEHKTEVTSPVAPQ